MDTRWDVIVVGAGLGGLSAAASLAKKGLKVLLLERHNVPGGYATSFVRGRYEFEVSLHELSGVGTAERHGPLYPYLEELGVARRVEFLPVHELYRCILPDLDVVVPVGMEASEEAICRAFPSEAPGIRRFLSRVHGLAEHLVSLEAELDGPLPFPSLVAKVASRPARLAGIARYLPATWGAVLARDVSDPKARAVLSQYWGYFGMAPSKVSFVYFAAAFHLYAKYGPVYVKGRSQALSNAFVAALEEHGGRARFNCGVARITAAGGRVTGVVTDAGEVLEAPRVVSNADPITTCRDLLGEAAPASFLRSLLRGRSVSPSTLNVYLGVACPPERLGLRHHENFVNTTGDFDGVWSRLRRVGPPETTLVTCYNSVDPAISPPGTTMVVLTALTGGDAWARLEPARYADEKRRVADAMLSAAEGIAPGLRANAEVVEVATPLTNMRYAGSPNGSIYGFDNQAHDHTVLRPGHRGPLPGLYFAGAWTQPGGGYEPCILSGRMAAGAVLADLVLPKAESRKSKAGTEAA